MHSVPKGFISYKNQREDSRYHRKNKISKIIAFFIDISRKKRDILKIYRDTDSQFILSKSQAIFVKMNEKHSDSLFLALIVKF